MANMFGALNRFIARLDADPNASRQGNGSPGAGGGGASASSNAHGFQVLRNTNTSLPLEPWFDFIIGINGHNIDNPDPNLFMTELRNCAGSTISLGVYSAKGQDIREAYVLVPPAGSALGIALQWSPLSLADEVWHILDVMPNSPADVAGLLPYSDYVIGSPEERNDSTGSGGGGALLPRGDGGLGELVEQFLDRPLRLYVYNQEYDVTRLVTLTPARHWGGDGALGCVLGYGALHRIPKPLTEPTQAPGETLFESSRDGGGEGDAGFPSAAAAMTTTSNAPGTPAQADFLVPANLDFAKPEPPTSPSPSSGAPPPPAGRAKKARAHHSAAPASGLDDYFAEGEQKSRELDNAPTPKSSGGLPPPPKAGGPPKAQSPAPAAES